MVLAKNQPKCEWILASASPRREEILKRIGLTFQIIPSNIEEPRPEAQENPARFALRAARMKAMQVARVHGSGLIVGADTVVVLQGRILGKPSSPNEARSMLEKLSGRWHEVVTGLCLVRCQPYRVCSCCVSTRVHFRKLTRAEIEWYLQTGEYFDKAGAYGAQGYASVFIDAIDGCYFNVVGFPVAAFAKLCRRLGIDLIQELRL